MIVIPAIDLREGRCVRLVEGDPGRETRYGDDPVAVARGFADGGAELLHVVDLDAALGAGSNGETVAAICAAVDVPVQTGGGLRDAEALERVLDAGAARAVLGTAAASDPAFVRRAVECHGDRVVVAVDVRDGRAMVRGWREAGPPAEELIAALDAAGAPRFLVTAIAADGTLGGPDLELYRRLGAVTAAPLLASGGVGGVGDLRALAELGLEGAVVGTALYEGAITLGDAMDAAGAARP